MAELLYRLGKFCADKAWFVISAWLILLLATGGAFFAWGGTLSSAVTIPGTATAQLTERLQQEMPQTSGGSGSVVFSTENGSPFTDEQKARIGDIVHEIDSHNGVESTIDPFTTTAERATQEKKLADAQEQLTAGRQQLDQQKNQLDTAISQAENSNAPAETLDTLRDQLKQLNTAETTLASQEQTLKEQASLVNMASNIRTVSDDNSAAIASIVFTKPQFEVTAETKDAVRATLKDNPISGVNINESSELLNDIPSGGVGEIVGVAIAAVVLFVMLGTLVAAGLPLLNAVLGVGVATLGALAFSGIVDMMSATPMLGLMIGLAVGIDYSLFILNRHRNQLRSGVPLRESIGLANGTSGTAVLFAGTTVLIALLALNITGIPFLGLMGTVAAAGVIVAVAIAVTLTPALLGLIGVKILPKKLRRADAPAPQAPTDSAMSTSKAVISLVGSVVVLGLIAIPSFDMRLGLPDGSSESPESTQYQAYQTISERFGAGANGPLLVVADAPANQDDAALTRFQVAVGEEIMNNSKVSAVAPIGASENKQTVAFQVIPQDGPTSESTEQLVHDLRAQALPEGQSGTLQVAGAASGNIDISEKLSSVLPLYLVVVVGLSVLILIVVFRSILLPLVATGGFILSLFAAFGGVTAIYQWGWLGPIFGVHDPGPVLNFLPTILVGVLFGLAMDYQLFLASGMREAYAHGTPARVAVTRGLHAGRTVVTAAAIIMISVFGGFVFSEMAMIRPIGFAMAFGVLLDAFVVRMVLIPAIMHLAGDKAWWLPRWLERLLPNVDIEGAALERQHAAHASGSAAENTHEFAATRK